MADTQINVILDLSRELALQAGERVMNYRGKGDFKIDYKTPRDLVTSADLEAEKIIIRGIKKFYPEHAILSEESAPEIAESHNFDDPLWILDPIDGTTNFARGHHQFGISIAFMMQGRVEVGVVYSPAQNEIFYAQRGRGAYLNDASIGVRKCSSLKEALIGIGRPFKRDEQDLFLKHAELVLSNCIGLRRIGAASLDLCWVACGRLDGFFETLNSWDIAAGALIAREAGARTGTMVKKGAPEGIPEDIYAERLLAAVPGLYPQLEGLLVGACDA